MQMWNVILYIVFRQINKTQKKLGLMILKRLSFNSSQYNLSFGKSAINVD